MCVPIKIRFYEMSHSLRTNDNHQRVDVNRVFSNKGVRVSLKEVDELLKRNADPNQGGRRYSPDPPCYTIRDR